jgi:4-hydroxybenzoate polyprenyltransferase
MSLIGHRTVLRLIYFLGVIRWYNLLLLGISQYLLSAYILLVKNGSDKKMAFWQFLTDTTVHSMALATFFTVAAIFIINSFYDLDKDWVNKSNMALMSRAVGTGQLANMYIVFNTLGLLFAFFASSKVAIYFVLFQFFGWFYSHKMQKIAVLRELSASLLTIAPLLAIWIHFSFEVPELGWYFLGLITVLFVKDIMKDLAGDRGNLIFGYKTVSIVAGQEGSKRLAWTIAFTAAVIFGIAYFQLDTVHDLLHITVIGLVLTFLNTTLWQRLDNTQHLKWMLRLQKSVVLFYFGALLALIIYRYVLFFVYNIIQP